MQSISKSEFDEIVSEYYTPSPEDSPKVVAKYSYEAHILAIEELIKTTREKYLDGQELTHDFDVEEPVYLFICDQEDLIENIIRAHRFNELGILHALIFVYIDIRLGLHALIRMSEYFQPWNLTELHWVSEEGVRSDPTNRRIDVIDSIFNRDQIKIVGLYGNTSAVWSYLQLHKYPIEWLTMLSLGIQYVRPSRRINMASPSLRVMDIDQEIFQYNDLSFDDVKDMMSRAEWLTIPGSYDELLSEPAPYLHTLKIIDTIPNTIIPYNLLELDLEYNSEEYLELDIDSSDLGTLRYRYTGYGTQGIPDFNWNEMTSLTNLELVGDNLRIERDDFDELINVSELKIPQLRDLPLPESIYEMPSLEILTLVDVSLVTLSYLELDRFVSLPDIIIELDSNSGIDDILEFISEHESSLNDQVMVELMKNLNQATQS